MFARKYSDSFQEKSYSKEKLVAQLPFGRGVLMWAILLFGYFLFITAWFSAGYTQGNGDIGWSNAFFGTKVDSTVSQAVNYGITAGRGIGSFLIGYLIVKLTHRYAALLALTLLVMAIPSVGVGFALAKSGSGVAGYALFIIFRLFMAVGGTTLIVLLQPVLAKTLRNQRQKAIFSSINPFGFNMGFIITTAIFISPSITTFLQTGDNWFYFSLAFSLLNLIPLLAYIVLGLNFDIQRAGEETKEEQEVVRDDTIFSLMREKNTWAWIVVYTIWLVAAVMPIVGTNVTAINSLLGIKNGDTTVYTGPFADSISNTALTTPGQWVRPWAVLFVGGILIGAFSIGRFTKTSFKRKPFMITVTAIGVLLYILSIISNVHGHVSLYLVFGFLFGVVVWGIQGPLLNNPYELPNATPKRMGLFFGIIWGMGYLGFTLVNVILAIVVDVSPIAYFALLTIIIGLLPVSLFFIKESKPNGLIRFNPFNNTSLTTKVSLSTSLRR
ncbi:MFS transporter family protein [[Mycoplasma] cavipharyngis]|uniref:hypothetical protein n=1 Tax=[Mycoplasma] cavipharyngis TaxID=92757 RepID=UPI003703C91D